MTYLPQPNSTPKDEGAADLIDSAGFRANVGIILLRRGDAALPAGELFLGGRPDGRGWQFPQGGVRRGETLEAALYRELAEEIGLQAQDVEVLGNTREWLRYRLPEQFRRRTQPWCIGQKQRWFLLRFNGEERQFRFDTTDRPEFVAWRWVPYWTPVREVIHFKRAVYSRALHELGALAFPEGLPPYPAWWTADLTPRRSAGRARSTRPSRRR